MSSPEFSPDSSSEQSQTLAANISQKNNKQNQSVTIPLQEHVKRGWDWIVFVWQMLRRVGGPLDLLLAFWTMMTLLITRLLVQLGLIRK